MEGLLQFLRSVKLFKCSVTILKFTADELVRVPQMILLLHHVDGKLEVVEPDSPLRDLADVDAVAAILANTVAESDLRLLASQPSVSTHLFQRICKRNSDHVDIIMMSGAGD